MIPTPIRPLAMVLVLAAIVLPGRSDAEPLRIVTYNVHGLPFVVNQLKVHSFPRARMRKIASQLGGFDLALLQEDFAYHRPLTRTFDRARVLRGGGPTFRPGYVVTAPLWLPLLAVFNVGLWPLFNGDGLTTIAVAPDLGVEPLASQRYRRCGDYLVGGNDCFAAKGFLATRVTLRNGAVVDVYNTHLEAGVEWALRSEDQDVRRSQLEELAAAVRRHSAGRAVIVAGDLNSDALRPEAFTAVENFMAVLGLADGRAWAETDARWRRKLDHVLYRDGCGARLGTPLVREERAFRTARSKPLSDHPAVSAAFDVQPFPDAECRGAGAHAPL